MLRSSQMDVPFVGSTLEYAFDSLHLTDGGVCLDEGRHFKPVSAGRTHGDTRTVAGYKIEELNTPGLELTVQLDRHIQLVSDCVSRLLLFEVLFL